MLSVVESACDFSGDLSRGNVVLESDCDGPPFNEAHDELKGRDAVTTAQAYAAQRGCSPAHLNGQPIGPYPVNADGEPLDRVRDGKGDALPQTHPRMQPARYRIDVPVTRPMR